MLHKYITGIFWLIFCGSTMLTAQEHRKVAWSPDPVPTAQPIEPDEVDQPSTFPELGMFLRYHRPLDQLAQNAYRPNVGLGLDIMSQPKAVSPFAYLQWGGLLTYDFAGSERFPLTLGFPFRGEEADLKLSNQNAGLHAVMRLITPTHFPLQLYVQGMVGSRLFSSQESIIIDGHDDEDDDCPEAVTLHRNFTLSYGAASGLRVRLAPQTYLEMRVSYLTGTRAGFLDLDQAYLAERNVVEYTLAESPRTTNWSASLGLTVPMDGSSSCTPSRAAMGSAVLFVPGFGSTSGGGGCN
jgi:hypothetical protein